MATLVLGAAGAAIGGSIGGAILGVSAATIGGFIGSSIGSVVDSWIISSLAPTQRIEGARLDTLRITSATEGAVIPRLYGRMRMGGNIIWATDFREETRTTTQGGGKGGGGGSSKVKTTEHLYFASFAIALCEGPITGIGRIWADGKPFDQTGITWRWYPGDEAQMPDPFIAAKTGGAHIPAYRGTAYVVFEDLPLARFGNRLPQLSFEIFRPLADPDALEGQVRTAAIGPEPGPFALSTQPVHVEQNGAKRAVNLNADPDTPDMLLALDRLEAAAPALEGVSLSVAWFGPDLRANLCALRPGIDARLGSGHPQPWSVSGITSANAHAVSRDAADRPAYLGTPADFTVVETVAELRARGLRITLAPTLLLDIAPGNALPDPWSDNAATLGQPAHPWRDRITCTPAPGVAGSADGTVQAAEAVAAFFGAASAAQFSVSGTRVRWTGPASEAGYRRMVLHYALLAKAAGGVDTFLIGSELSGLTGLRDATGASPAVTALRRLATDVRAILGPQTRIGYAAGWTEYGAAGAPDGSGTLRFPLDPLWADEAIDFVGIANYMPLADWRDGVTHHDAAQGWPSTHDRAYLQSNITGGEFHDWSYASDLARAQQTRTPIVDHDTRPRDIAVANGSPGPWIIGPTGLVANALHTEVGRGGYFHPGSGTSEGQFLMIWASALAAHALHDTDPITAQSWAARSRLLTTPLEEVFYRRPYRSDPAETFLPHWLNAAKAPVQLQQIVLGLEIPFTAIGDGRMRGRIPRDAGGHRIGKLYHVRAHDAGLLWENPYSPVLGQTYPILAGPDVDADGATIEIAAAGTALSARVCYSHDDGREIGTGAPYEAWPTWRLLDQSEIACAGDSLRWSLLAYAAMAKLHGDPLWSTLAAVTRANAVRACAVDDARWIFRPMIENDQQVSGTFTYQTRATRWYREPITGYIRADIASGPGESQLGKGLWLTLPADDSLVVRAGASLPTADAWVYLDIAPSYAPETRYRAQLHLSGTGIDEIVLPLSAFRRTSDGAPLSGPVTVHVAGVIDTIPSAHSFVMASFRPLKQEPHPYAPWLVPFTTNLLQGSVVSWRGVPGIGYQAPDLWVEIGGPDAATGARTQAEFLRDAQDAWAARTGFRGPMAHAYVWDRPEADDVGGTPDTWIYTWHDPNSFWAGYQYRAIEATARFLWRADGDTAQASGHATALAVVADFFAWLATTWTDPATPPPTTIRPEAITTDYDEPHFAALILRACAYCRASDTWNADPARRDRATTLAAQAWQYMERHAGGAAGVRGAWPVGDGLYYGYWHAEIVLTLSELLLLGSPLIGSVMPAAILRTRLVDADAWLTAHTGCTLAQEHGEPWVLRAKALREWWRRWHHPRVDGLRSDTPTDWVPQMKPIVFTELGCPAIDRGANDPAAHRNGHVGQRDAPHASRGWRDDTIQRAVLEAQLGYWGQAEHNFVSWVYGAPMIDLTASAVAAWDPRPYPFFPELRDVWPDTEAWQRGHGLTGRLGAVALSALVRALCQRSGLPASQIDVSGLSGAVEGYAITDLESPRASIAGLARYFGFDAVESEGRIRFIMRGGAPVATIEPDSLVAAGEGELFELIRGQETELPQALKWQIARADADYEAAQVEARRITVAATRTAAERFAFAAAPEDAERRCRRALMEAWTGRETATFRLPPSRLALDPADVVSLAHDTRVQTLRLVSIADGAARGIEAVHQDREAHDRPPGRARPSRVTAPIVFAQPNAVLMDLPQIRETQPAHQPLLAVHARPWPGEIAVLRSASNDGYALFATSGARSRIGVLLSDLQPGPTSRFDLANTLSLSLLTGSLESVTDLSLFGGENSLAIESAPGIWEIVQAGSVTLIGPGQYHLTRLLRGQRGTEAAMGNPTPVGARVVVLDETLTALPVAEAELAIPWNWRIGPASRPATDETFTTQSFTPAGLGLRPFSVVHVEQPWRRSRSPGDLTIRWTRRSRALAADNWGALDAPLAEDREAYAVDILDGNSVKRAFETTTTSVAYSAAEQIEDWGAPLGPGDALSIRIVQLSALAGHGAPTFVTLTF